MKKEIEKIRQNWEKKILAMDDEMLATVIGMEASRGVAPILAVIKDRISTSTTFVELEIQQVVAEYMREELK